LSQVLGVGLLLHDFLELTASPHRKILKTR
jgi:hypothetical protein